MSLLGLFTGSVNLEASWTFSLPPKSLSRACSVPDTMTAICSQAGPLPVRKLLDKDLMIRNGDVTNGFTGHGWDDQSRCVWLEPGAQQTHVVCKPVRCANPCGMQTHVCANLYGVQTYVACKSMWRANLCDKKNTGGVQTYVVNKPVWCINPCGVQTHLACKPMW